MPVAAAKALRASDEARSTLRARLEARRDEIEAVALTRVRAIADPGEVPDPAYAEGLRAAVAAAIDYGIETTGCSHGDPPIPVALLGQARMAARVGIPLDTVLRRYFAGYSLLGYFILEEASQAGITDGAELKHLLGAHAGLFDRLLAAVGEEHTRESQSFAPATDKRRQAERIERLLAGEPVDTGEIRYDFESWHVGVVAAAGEGDGRDEDIERLLRGLAVKLDCRILLLPRQDGVLWAWLGSRRSLDPAEMLHSVAIGDVGAEEAIEVGDRNGGEAVESHARASIAFGEPAETLAGWRLTHRQAVTALPVAQSGTVRKVRYADIALVAAILADDLCAASLRQSFLAPLAQGRDGGATLLDTLRAYFAADRNVSSAAAAIGVSRQTVINRLKVAEQLLGRILGSCAPELEAALRLDEFMRE